MSYWKCLAVGVVAAASLSTFATDVMAAGTKPAPKPAVSATAPAVTGATPPSSTAGLPEDKATSNRPAEQNWLKVCDVIAAGKKAAGQRSCMLRQVIVANQQFLGSFLLRNDPSQQSPLLAVAAVPLGVLLPYGLSWQIDGQKPVKVPYMLCDKQSCASQLVINDQYIAALKGGHSLSLTAKSRSKDLVVTISLAGFGTVYDGQAAVTSEELNKDTTGGAARQLMLQDRAQQIRKQLDSAASPAK